MNKVSWFDGPRAGVNIYDNPNRREERHRTIKKAIKISTPYVPLISRRLVRGRPKSG